SGLYPLLAVNAEVVVEHRQRPIGVEVEVQVLVDQEIVSRSLADNPEVVYKGQVVLTVLQGSLESLLRYAGCLVFVPGSLAHPTNALRLEVELATDVVSIDCKCNQRVQWAVKVHDLSRTASSAGNEYT